MNKNIAIFKRQRIRRTWHNDRWYFSVVDIVRVLTDSSNPRRYWSDLKIKLLSEGFQLYEKIVQLKIVSTDGKRYITDCVTTENAFRLIQSIPSKKAEPFKLWLARVGYERVKEIEDPSKAIKRITNYLSKGYSLEWAEKRLAAIGTRKQLTGQWKKQKIDNFALLTDEIYQAAFGKTFSELKSQRKLKKEDLRDHMTSMELIITMFAEVVTEEITKKTRQCKKAARIGGSIAGKARKEAEKEIARSKGRRTAKTH